MPVAVVDTIVVQLAAPGVSGSTTPTIATIEPAVVVPSRGTLATAAVPLASKYILRLVLSELSKVAPTYAPVGAVAIAPAVVV